MQKTNIVVSWEDYCRYAEEVANDLEWDVQSYVWLIEELPKSGLLQKLGIKIDYNRR